VTWLMRVVTDAPSSTAWTVPFSVMFMLFP
jgi:hypothetical protein